MPASLSLLGGSSPLVAHPAPDAEVEGAIEALAQVIYIPQASELELPLPLTEMPAEYVPLQDQAQQAAAIEALADPQQWLLMMLNQQAVNVQVLDSDATSAPPLSSAGVLKRLAADAGVLGVNEPLPLLDAAMTQSRAKQGEGERMALSLDTQTLMPGRGVTWTATPVMSVATAAPAASQWSGLPNAAPVGLELADVTVPQPVLAGATASSEPVLERGLKLVAPQARWGEQMLNALRETVEIQVQQRFQQATIRLDPPELGSLEIFISHESGRLSVHISAAQTDVARLLAHSSERMRQELVQQNLLHVDVQVSSDSRGQSSREQARQQHESVIAQAMEEVQMADSVSKGYGSDVLVTV
nr:flagellar hook-length control protein FliK [uncultured Pseudomonas sp.]